jgi:hypothetical protein
VFAANVDLFGEVMLLPAHAYVYPGVPPVTTAFIAPVEPPLHDTGVIVPDKFNIDGCETNTESSFVHPFEAVTVTR